MASVDFQKLHTKQEVKQVLRHCDREERLKTETHSNEHIDKSRTHKNVQLKNRDYKTTCKKFDDRLAYLDSQPDANKRKDRVIAFGLEIPVPEKLPQDKASEWLRDAFNVIQEYYPGCTVLNRYMHFDEQHEYTKPDTHEKVMSRVHGHLVIMPDLNGGKLNGKEFSSRNNMRKVQALVHEMSLEKYDVEFMDGSKRKSKSTVEELKRQSEKAEIEALQEQKQALQEQVSSLQTVLQGLEAQKQALEDFNEEISSKSSLKAFKGKLEGKTDGKRITGKIVKATKKKLQERAGKADELTSNIQGVSAEGVYHSLGE